MKYLFLIHGDADAEAAMTGDERMRVMQAHMEYAQMLRDIGAYVSSEALHGPETAVVVRPGPAPMVTDGPFAETKEAIGGFYVVEVATREQALELAGRIPVSPGVAVEVLQAVEL